MFRLSVVIYLYVVTQLLPARAFVPYLSRGVIRRNRKFSGAMMWMSILSIAHLESDKILVSRFLPIAATGYYGFASSMTMRATMVTGSIAPAAYPAISNALSGSGLNAALRQYRKLHDLICPVPLFAGIAFAAPWLFTYMFDARIARTLIQPTILLCVATYLNATLHMPYIMSLACGRPNIALRSSIALCITLPGSIFLSLLVWTCGGRLVVGVLPDIRLRVHDPGGCKVRLQTPVAAWVSASCPHIDIGSITYGATATVGHFGVQAL